MGHLPACPFLAVSVPSPAVHMAAYCAPSWCPEPRAGRAGRRIGAGSFSVDGALGRAGSTGKDWIHGDSRSPPCWPWAGFFQGPHKGLVPVNQKPGEKVHPRAGVWGRSPDLGRLPLPGAPAVVTAPVPTCSSPSFLVLCGPGINVLDLLKLRWGWCCGVAS